MAVEFLTDEQAARYGSFYGAPSRADLERFFFGRYSFQLPDPPGGLRPLRDPHAADEE
ncbi:hypothetical protein [Microtetraspora malaysiensis]|uniref:hypothetical protein n=1 Tax=Microtetraspora malaysiensis TaxID=161358 RepID=UPI003D89B6C6